jgi:hypothetical protein
MVDEAERAALARALSPVPQDRFPSCREFMAVILKGHGLKAIRGENGTPIKVVKETSEHPALKPPSKAGTAVVAPLPAVPRKSHHPT